MEGTFPSQTTQDEVKDMYEALKYMTEMTPFQVFRKMRDLEAQKSEYEKVHQFTVETGVKVATSISALSKDEVKFLIGMCVSELVELAQTVCDSPQEAMDMVSNSVSTDLKPEYQKPSNTLGVIADQADACVDCWYYALNAFAKKSVDLSKVFDVVHSANMAKRFPDGKFHTREDGKVLKPPEWQSPDVYQEIGRQVMGLCPSSLRPLTLGI